MQSCTRPSAAFLRLVSSHRRTFFKLPRINPFQAAQPETKPGSKLRKVGSTTIYEEGRVMPYTPQQLYRVISDVDSYSSFVPYAAASRVLSARKGKGKEVANIREKGWVHGEAANEDWELEAELRVGAMGFEEGYVSRVECRKWDRVTATAINSPLFRRLTTQWTFTPLPASSPTSAKTQVDLEIAYAFMSPFHAIAAGAVWDKVSQKMVGEFEKRLDSVYGR